ncbi:two-component sensor histidine kinase [Paenibacillus sp. VTT E-133280]|uniref:sensor histidine kinase n=2 Tax=Paenibacillus TaxID=44249 RepID=UPI000BA011ED|nr:MULTISPECIES: HAMP domain-containing sensor histidine kinase [unclassified Paenibacillus]MDH6369220.1 signal transduction histidine kinase [Paenibacillus sp. PastF-3]OZQ68048.1 two-component sensor histidine kinase [Paenibacillus sp. VTT E-133280]OZQ97299.1 two-component sensor histidine kinase [Paenibacillus sp. VTT E-133291]
MKRLWSNRDQRPLQSSLTLDFLLFICILFFLVIVYYLFINLDVTHMFEKNKIADPDLKVEASAYRDNLEHGIETKRLLRSGGWIEILGQDKKVIDVVGEKKDDVTQYTDNQLLNNLENGEDQAYFYSLTTRNNENESEWLLLKIPREVIDISINSDPLVEYFNHSLSYYVFLGVGMVLLLIIVYSYWVARRIRKPLRIITLGLKQMIEGNYDTRISLYAEKEFSQIGETFNYMADVIEKTTKEKRQAEESKKRMMVDLSHDLKTPITSIQGFAQALVEGRGEDEERQKRYLTYIYNKSSQVTKLIQNMVELLKIDSPDFLLRMERHELGEFIREIVADSYGEIEQKNFILQLNVPEQEVFASFDAELLSSVVHNLISNALTYNPPGTHLRVEVIPSESEVAIEIADTGVGIPEELWSTLFDPFVRGDKARSTTGGTGLGLSIAMKNTEKMGGTLHLSREKKEPTVFTIRIPK